MPSQPYNVEDPVIMPDMQHLIFASSAFSEPKLIRCADPQKVAAL